MAFCPRCGVEYREDATQCSDCKVKLVPGPPPPEAPDDESKFTDEAKLMRVRVFSGPTSGMEANLARNLLKSQGIPCMLPGEFTAEMLPGIDPIQIFVREDDAEQAAEILQAYFDSPRSEWDPTQQ